MSKNCETKTEAAAETVTMKAESKVAPTEIAADEKASPRVYCGPTVRGVVKQYTVFAGDISAELNDFIEQHPAAKALLVPLVRFAQTRKQTETAGTAEAILYQKIKSEL